MTTNLTVSDMLWDHDVAGAMDRMRSLLRMDPDAPVDAAAVRARYMETREHLKAVVPPAPFRVVVEVIR